MKKHIAIIVCLAVIAMFSSSMVFADEMSDARAAALKILGKLEQKQNKEVWNANVSDWFKEK